MAIVMQMEWPGVGLDTYNEARERVGWEREVPPGAIFHVVGVVDGVFRVTDVWESEAQFNDFFQNRVMPVIAELNLPGEPTITIYEAGRIFAPAYEKTPVGV
jgi:hypothetical protein